MVFLVPKRFLLKLRGFRLKLFNQSVEPRLINVQGIGNLQIYPKEIKSRLGISQNYNMVCVESAFDTKIPDNELNPTK